MAFWRYVVCGWIIGVAGFVGCAAPVDDPPRGDIAHEPKARPGPAAVEYDFRVTYPIEHQVLYPWEDATPGQYRTEIRCGVTDRDAFDLNSLADPVIEPGDDFIRIGFPRDAAQLECGNAQIDASTGAEATCLEVDRDSMTATVQIRGRLAPDDDRAFVSDQLVAGCKLRRSVALIPDLAVHVTGLFDAAVQVQAGQASGDLILGSAEARLDVGVALRGTTNPPDYFDCSLSLGETWWEELGYAVYSGFGPKHFRLMKNENYQSTIDVVFHRGYPAHHLTCTPQWSLPATTTGVGVSTPIRFVPKETAQARWQIDGELTSDARAELDIEIEMASWTRTPPDYFSCTLGLGESWLDNVSYAFSTGYLPTRFRITKAEGFKVNLPVAYPREYPEHDLECVPRWNGYWLPSIAWFSRKIEFADGQRSVLRWRW